MYAGTPANTALIIREIHELVNNDPERKSAGRIQETIRTAYRRFIAHASSFDVIGPFDMTIEEFKKDGLQLFGSAMYKELANQIRVNAQQILEQLLVTGWGHAPASAMLYEIGPSGEFLHNFSGFAVIGSGAQVAQSNLLLLRQSRHRTLSDTIFNVAAAKFASEKSTGLDVGQATAIWVSRKKTDGDPTEFVAESLLEKEIDDLRDLWEQHVRPKLPDEARVAINDMSKRITGGTVSVTDMVEHLNAAARLRDKSSLCVRGRS